MEDQISRYISIEMSVLNLDPEIIIDHLDVPRDRIITIVDRHAVTPDKWSYVIWRQPAFPDLEWGASFCALIERLGGLNGVKAFQELLGSRTNTLRIFDRTEGPAFNETADFDAGVRAQVGSLGFVLEIDIEPD